jgi:hypothetical protein
MANPGDTLDPPLTAEESLRVSRLTQSDLWEIDRVLLAHVSAGWLDVAGIIAAAIGELGTRVPGIPDVYYAQRVRHLAEVGNLESQGDLRYMRRSQVRLPKK